MKNGIGIWMDQTKAVIVKVHGEETTVQHLAADVESKHRSTGGVRSSRPYWHRSVNSNRRADAHRTGSIRQFFEAVAETLGDEEVLVLLGPGEGKEAFASYLEEQGREAPVTIAAGSRLTEPQIVARIKREFGYRPPRRLTGQDEARV